MADEIRSTSGAPFSSSAPTAATSARQRKNPFSHLWTIFRNEIQSLHPRLMLCGFPTLFLPHFAFNRVRTALYRLAGISIGRGTLILGRIELAGPGAIQKRLHIGSDSQITTPLYADVCEPIRIGDRVYIGHHVVLITTNHAIGPAYFRCGAWQPAPITIEDGVWIGACATILPGVTIGRGSVVAAGAVVTKSVPPDTLVGGVPARVLRQLDSEEKN